MRKEFANVVRNAVSVLTVLCGLVVSGPAGAQNQTPPPSRSDAPTTAPVKSDGASAAVDPKTYVIGAQDILMIKVWREMDFTGPYTVRPDGKIILQLKDMTGVVMGYVHRLTGEFVSREKIEELQRSKTTLRS